ncbi:MAG TPA: tetratricopeptide repeat protein [Acidobacteriota bacterium]|nr:tetratricopeptide repeat protein [Acidobacteriota bacterium]
MNYRQGNKDLKLRVRFLMLFLLGALAVCGQQTPRDQFELRGRIVPPNGKTFRDALPVIFIHGSTTPFAANTLSDVSGKFKFNKLRPGTYTLIVAVPRIGEMQRTVEVGPSFADPKGAIEVSFVFDRKISAEDLHQVSVRQLSVPESARRQYEKADERLGKLDIEGAIGFLKKAVELAPQFAAAWNHLGTIAYQTGNYTQAEIYFREALKQEPDFYPALVNLGGALLSLPKIQDSLPVNLSAVRARPDDPLAHSQLGQSYFMVGQLENAETHLRQAKALDPAHFSHPQLVLAEIYNRRGDSQALLAELEEFLRYHPDSPQAPVVKKTLEQLRARGR